MSHRLIVLFEDHNFKMFIFCYNINAITYKVVANNFQARLLNS